VKLICAVVNDKGRHCAAFIFFIYTPELEFNALAALVKKNGFRINKMQELSAEK